MDIDFLEKYFNHNICSVLRADTSDEGFPLISHAYFVDVLVREYKPEQVVSLGMFYGLPFLLFCQAVSDAALSTQCYAVDRLKEEAGVALHGKKLHQSIKKRIDKKYAAFTHVIQTSFDDALMQFGDASIDILHIDGLHTYEAIRHDFETWLPKVKPGSIILFHHACVHRDDFGFGNLWSEISEQTEEAFIFKHSLAIWRKPGGERLESPLLSILFDKAQDEAASHVSDFFKLMYNYYVMAVNAGVFSSENEKLKYMIATYDQEYNLLLHRISEMKDLVETGQKKCKILDEYIIKINRHFEQQYSVLMSSTPVRSVDKSKSMKDRVISKLKGVCRKMILASCLFPASFLYYSSFKEWFSALKSGKRFFMDIRDNAVPILEDIQSRGKLRNIFVGIPLRFAIKCYEFASVVSSVKYGVMQLKLRNIVFLIGRQVKFFFLLRTFRRSAVFAICLFPATFIYYPSWKEWIVAFRAGQTFFTEIKEDLIAIRAMVYSHGIMCKILVGIPLRWANRIYQDIIAETLGKNNKDMPRWLLTAAPLELIPGLDSNEPEARAKAIQYLEVLPKDKVSIAGYASCLLGENIDFSKTKTVVIAHWDPMHTIDSYVKYQCEHFKELGWRVVIASADKINIDIIDCQGWVDAIVYRKCPGYDFTSWKAAFEIFPSLHECSELILTNDSYFGPVGSFAPVHETMDRIVCDFWGLVSSNQLQPHIQSYYLVFHANVLCHPAFRKFFDLVPLSNERDIAVSFEVSLSLWLALQHFRPAAFVPTHPDSRANYTYDYWDKILEVGVPIIKREFLIKKKYQNHMRGWASYCARKAYPLELIFSYLKRRCIDITSLDVLVKENLQDMQLPESGAPTFSEVMAVFAENTPLSYRCLPSVTVIVPIHNGLAHLQQLLPGLLRHTPSSVPLLFIDDASSQPEVTRFLERELATYSQAKILRNPQKLGFIGAVNYGMSLVKTCYAVLVNTDVLLPHDWLPRLVAPFENTEEGRIASVTPFTNAGAFFSFPIREKNNHLIPPYTLEEIDAAFLRLNQTVGQNCEIHSGVGFCMAVNMTCWREIGSLDEETFGRGYGGEYDWCMRAISRGWRNVLVPNLFVYHAHGSSFDSKEKEKLGAMHLSILQKRWPKAVASISAHAQRNPWETYRTMASWLMAASGKGCLVMIDFDIKEGETFAYREAQIKHLKEAGWHVLLLLYTQGGYWKLISHHLPAERPTPLYGIYEMIDFFDRVSVKRIFVNNLAFYPRIGEMISFLKKVRTMYNIHLHYSYHNFLSLCPSFFLIDCEGEYCAGGDPKRCDNCISCNMNRIVLCENINSWRANWKSFLIECDSITCFSQDAKNLIEQFYSLKDKLTVVEPALLGKMIGTFVPPEDLSELHIAFIGRMHPIKGSKIVSKIARAFYAKKINAKIHFWGINGHTVAHPSLINHGLYQREDLPELLKEHAIAAIIFPSIWPETFSYVVQDCMLMNAPLVCFDLGAPPERLRSNNYAHAEIVPEISAEAMFAGLERLLKREYDVTYEDFFLK